MSRETRRKSLLGLNFDTPEGAGPATPLPDLPARPRRGAIGAVSNSLAEMRANAVIDIDAFLIEAAGAQDRLESDPEEDATLARSIAEYGQQVPVLVRPHPDKPDHYQIVYGRRRVLAMRDLGLPVKALVRNLDDKALILAQGQENSARRNLSFIEKVNFARQLQEAGYDRKVIIDALSIDKTLVSRMLAVADRIDPVIIQGIGAAPSVGRDRWLALADMVESLGDEVPAEEIAQMAAVLARDSASSDARFEAAFGYLESLVARRSKALAPKPAAKGVARNLVTAHDGSRLAMLKRNGTKTVIQLDSKDSAGFDDWLIENLARLHQAWQDDKPQH